MFSSGSASPQKLLYSPGGSDLLVFVCVHSLLSSLSSLRLSVKLPTVHRCCLTRGLHNTVKNSSLGEGAMNMEFLKCAPCVILHLHGCWGWTALPKLGSSTGEVCDAPGVATARARQDQG